MMKLSVASFTTFCFFYLNTLNVAGKKAGGKTTVVQPGPSKIFPYKPYNQFYISRGPAGNCEASANKVFRKPLAGVSASDLSDVDLINLYTMTQESVDNQTYIGKAVDHARKNKSGDGKTILAALLRGQTCNNILKIIATQVTIKVQKDRNLTVPNEFGRTADLKEKLTKNTNFDKKDNGLPMLSFFTYNEGPAAIKKALNDKTPPS